MMNPRHLLFVAAAGAALFAAGCSTPETRIRQNPEVFNRLSAEEQELIRQGRVGIGFDQEMVRLAVGDPDRVWNRTDAQGSTESWSYTTYESADGFPLFTGHFHRFYGPRYYSRWGAGYPYGYYPYYMSYPARREREVFKVVFKEGRVIAIEQQTRG
jgi:hypothetical protein